MIHLQVRVRREERLNNGNKLVMPWQPGYQQDSGLQQCWHRIADLSLGGGPLVLAIMRKSFDKASAPPASEPAVELQLSLYHILPLLKPAACRVSRSKAVVRGRYEAALASSKAEPLDT